MSSLIDLLSWRRRIELLQCESSIFGCKLHYFKFTMYVVVCCIVSIKVSVGCILCFTPENVLNAYWLQLPVLVTIGCLLFE